MRLYDDDELLTEKTAAKILGVERRTLSYWRLSKEGPSFIALGKKTIRYKKSDLLAWLASKHSDNNPED